MDSIFDGGNNTMNLFPDSAADVCFNDSSSTFTDLTGCSTYMIAKTNIVLMLYYFIRSTNTTSITIANNESFQRFI